MKFPLRDLLWLTFVVALSLGWWLDRSRQSTNLETYQRKAERYERLLKAIGMSTDDRPMQICVLGNFESDVLRVSTSGLIEISIGADDGLKPGYILNVVRDNQYLGELIITETSPNRAIGRLDPKTQRGEVQKGDKTMKSLSGR